MLKQILSFLSTLWVLDADRGDWSELIYVIMLHVVSWDMMTLLWL